MVARFRLGSQAKGSCRPIVLLLLLFFSTKAFAEDNIWRSTFGQTWFYEVRSWSGQVLAGTWWEHSLTPGHTYQIKFTVQSKKGELGVLLGDKPIVALDRTGSYSFDFYVPEGGKRQIIFRAMGRDVMAAVNEISVTRKQAASGSSGGGNWLPKGHYVSFARERNLQTEMVEPLEAPWRTSDYHVGIARDIEDALKTPGVKGFYMHFDWRTLEVADGVYDWRLMDANMAVARKYGLKFVVQVSDRSFNGTNILPKYFPSQYVLWSTGNGNSGVVAKRWDPYVYNRLIRLYKAIANRYGNDSAFGGISTSETATGSFGGGDYSVEKYRHALTQIATQTQAALKSGKLFLYLNFLQGGAHLDMNKDVRVQLLKDVPHENLVIGAPDITPDVPGMPGSVNSYRIHVRKHMPSVSQFCHLQHVDQGFRGLNVKSNKHRREYRDRVAAARERESKYWFSGTPGAYHFDDLRAPNDNSVDLHPSWVLGELWKPWELLQFGVRNFKCDYVLWHYREWAGWNEFGWEDVQPVIRNNQYFYQN